MNTPFPVVPGERLRADQFNSLVAAIRARTPIAGPGIRISESPAGFHINADIRPGSGSSNPIKLIIPGPVSLADVPGEGLCLFQKWDQIDISPAGIPTVTPNVENPDKPTPASAPNGPNTTYAFFLKTASHADDHTNGLIP